MARFKYLGEKPRSWVPTYGDTHTIKVPLKNGTTQTLLPTVGDFFPWGQDIGYEITDERALTTLRADERFEEIV
jgi:hypothetical protein